LNTSVARFGKQHMYQFRQADFCIANACFQQLQDLLRDRK
jgi:hypothetical protein